MDKVLYKQLTVRGSLCYTGKTWDRMMRIYAAGRVRLQDLVSVKLPISDWRRAFELCVDRSALKVLLHP
jgi:L-iditol 2-dehydrogenase